MEGSFFEDALARMRRAWREAEHLYNNRPEEEKKRLRAFNAPLSYRARAMGEVFNKLEDNPCASCGRCCSKAGMSSGFFSHKERERIIAKGVSAEEFVVPSWEGEPSWRCLFLGPEGCNVPTKFRSRTCLTYVCMDKMVPEIMKQGLRSKYEKARQQLEDSHQRAFGMSSLPSQVWEATPESFGEG